MNLLDMAMGYGDKPKKLNLTPQYRTAAELAGASTYVAPSDASNVNTRAHSMQSKTGFTHEKPNSYESDRIDPYLYQSFLNNAWNNGLDRTLLVEQNNGRHNNEFEKWRFNEPGYNNYDDYKKEVDNATKDSYYHLWNNTGRWGHSIELNPWFASFSGRKAPAYYDNFGNVNHSKDLSSTLAEAAHGYQFQQAPKLPDWFDLGDHSARVLFNSLIGGSDASETPFESYYADNMKTVESQAHGLYQPVIRDQYSKSVNKLLTPINNKYGQEYSNTWFDKVSNANLPQDVKENLLSENWWNDGWDYKIKEGDEKKRILRTFGELVRENQIAPQLSMPREGLSLLRKALERKRNDNTR